MSPFPLQRGGLGFGRYRDATPRAILFHGNGADGATTFFESGNNHLTGTRTGNAELKTDTAAFGASSLRYYQGTSSFVEFTGPAQLFTGTTWTIECIVELTDLSSTNNTGTDYNTVIGLRSGATRTRIFGAGSTNFVMFGSLFGSTSTGSRFHLAASCDGSGASFYINGSRVGTAAAINLSGKDTVSIGCVNDVLPGAAWSHGGKIEEVRLTNGVRLYSGASYTLQTDAFQDP